MGLFAVGLAILMLHGQPGVVPGSAAGESEQQMQGQSAPGASGQQEPQQQSTQQPPPPRPSVNPDLAADDLFSIDRLRQDLQRKPTIIFIVPDPNIPRFKVEVEGKRWQLPSLQQRLAAAIPKMAVQVPFGGTTAADMTRLNTPPQFLGSSGFTNAEVAQLPLFAVETWFGKTMVKKALEARHNAESARMREQIRQELAAVEEHNARVAAGQSDGAGDDAKKADKKKQDAKKQVKKKKKDGQTVDRRP
jgi:hypothetical protein